MAIVIVQVLRRVPACSWRAWVAESLVQTVGADLNWRSPPGAAQVQGLRVRDGELP